MPVNRNALFAKLEQLGIAATTVEHTPSSNRQVLREPIPGARTKARMGSRG
jgi:hypothetical protein